MDPLPLEALIKRSIILEKYLLVSRASSHAANLGKRLLTRLAVRIELRKLRNFRNFGLLARK